MVGRGGGGGMSALVGGMLDALPHMWRARVPAHQVRTTLYGDKTSGNSRSTVLFVTHR